MNEKEALKRFEMENKIIPESDAIYFYDKQKHDDQVKAKPWIAEYTLVKMTMHAKSGGNIEIMGLMTGKIDGDTMFVIDSFALPVEGTETRVNAAQEGYEYMVQYLENLKKLNRHENILGWYHSHPGYGCWLSGIDVATQRLNQQWQEPFVAVVIDPHRTASAGKVEIGAFRTYPEGKAPQDSSSGYQSIPVSKIQDFGVHCKEYYPLEVGFFKSSLNARLFELLWKKYWINTLTSNPVISDRKLFKAQIEDLAEKVSRCESALPQSGRLTMEKSQESGLAKLCKESTHQTSECCHGLMQQILKSMILDTSKSV